MAAPAHRGDDLVVGAVRQVALVQGVDQVRGVLGARPAAHGVGRGQFDVVGDIDRDHPVGVHRGDARLVESDNIVLAGAELGGPGSQRGDGRIGRGPEVLRLPVSPAGQSVAPDVVIARDVLPGRDAVIGQVPQTLDRRLQILRIHRDLSHDLTPPRHRRRRPGPTPSRWPEDRNRRPDRARGGERVEQVGEGFHQSIDVGPGALRLRISQRPAPRVRVIDLGAVVRAGIDGVVDLGSAAGGDPEHRGHRHAETQPVRYVEAQLLQL